MEQQYATIRQLGGEVLAVSFSKPERVAAFLQPHPLPFPTVSDPELEAYRTFTLGRTSWQSLLGLGVMARFAGMLWRGWLPRKPSAGDDLWQLGGDFVLDRERRLVFAYRSSEPTDRPAPEVLIEAMRRAAEAVKLPKFS